MLFRSRGLARQYHGAIPHITSRVPLPSFLQARSFLLLEDHRAEQAAHQQAAHALYANRAPAAPAAPPATAPPSPASAPYGAPSGNGGQRGKGKGKRKGKGKAPDAGGSSSSPAPSARPPAPAPGNNSWTGYVQAWPVAWRAPGAGVLGPPPGAPHHHAYTVTAPQYMVAPPGYGYSTMPQGYGTMPHGYGAPLFQGTGTPGTSSSARSEERRVGKECRL